MSLKIEPFTDMSFYYTNNQTYDAIKAEAEPMFAASAARIGGIANRRQFQAYRAEKRKQFIASLGGLPEEKTPLRPVTTGSHDRNGYRLENVVFQSFPRVHVTALLYIPHELKKKNPAVLFVCGHSKDGKGYPVYQRVQIELARAGFVVLAVDPVGQGERCQYLDPRTGHTTVFWGTREHSHAGMQCELTGSGVARYFVWDMIRAVDYLCSLDFVDPKRIGVTGNSGGGTQSSYLMMADERVAAAMPCTYINSRRNYLFTGQAHDSEQNLFGSIRDGVDHDDYIACFAPKPAQIGAARFDYFTLKGTVKTFERARRVYRLLGKEENVSLAVGDHTHQYSPVLRQAAVNWFLRHLKGEEPTFRTRSDEKIPVEPPQTYQCCTTGNVMAEFARERTVFDLNLDYLRRHKPPLRGKVKRTEIAKALGIANLDERRKPTYPIQYVDKELLENCSISRETVQFYSEDQINLSGLFYKDARAAGARLPVVLVVPEDGLNDGSRVKSVVLNTIRAGKAAFVCDVRGVGAGALPKINYFDRLGFGGAEFVLANDCWMMGTSLVGKRVFDVLRAVDYLCERSDVDRQKLSVYGCDFGAIYAFFAALLEPRLKAGVFERMIPSYEAIVREKNYRLDVVARIIPHGILRHFDIPRLKRQLKGKFSYPSPVEV